MRVVIDTNVLISAILRDRIPEEVILFVAGRDDMEWIVSSEIIEEYKEVLGRPKFGLPDDVRHSWFNMLDLLTIPFDVDLVLDFPRNQKDAKIPHLCHIRQRRLFYNRRQRFHTRSETSLHYNPVSFSVQTFRLRKISNS